MKLDKNKVLIAMSGGVDSSAAAALLLEQGYDVMALTITTHKIDDECMAAENQNGCCTYQNTVDAHKVCEVLGIEHKLVDLTDVFGKTIIKDFVDEYLKGRTPNPCVQCNKLVKWGYFLDKADRIGAHYIATGHYSSVRYDDSAARYVISKGRDPNKDQSYVIWGLDQKQLARTLLPVGGLLKSETRQIAKKFNLPTFDKSESQEICFIPDNNYRNFLRRAIPGLDRKIGEGNIIMDGKVVGRHSGFVNFTIGQRKGIGVTHARPLYVKNIDAGLNLIEVAEGEGLLCKGLLADNVNMAKYDRLEGKRKFNVKIRYNDPGEDAFCSIDADGILSVEFVTRRRAVTPGQSVVLYESGDIVAGGLILDKF